MKSAGITPTPNFADEIKNFEDLQKSMAEIAFRLGYIQGNIERLEQKVDNVAELLQQFVDAVAAVTETEKDR